MPQYINVDSGNFCWGTYKGESVDDVAISDPDYIDYLLGDHNPFNLDASERDVLEQAREKSLEA